MQNPGHVYHFVKTGDWRGEARELVARARAAARDRPLVQGRPGTAEVATVTFSEREWSTVVHVFEWPSLVRALERAGWHDGARRRQAEPPRATA